MSAQNEGEQQKKQIHLDQMQSSKQLKSESNVRDTDLSQTISTGQALLKPSLNSLTDFEAKILSAFNHSIAYVTIVVTLLEYITFNIYKIEGEGYMMMFLVGDTILIAILLLTSMFPPERFFWVKSILMKLLVCNQLYWKCKQYLWSRYEDGWQHLFAFCQLMLFIVLVFLVDKYIHLLYKASKTRLEIEKAKQQMTV